MATLKVVVSSSRRYFCAARCWEAGETEAVLEDLPDLPLEQQLAQLDAAKGGQQMNANGLERGNEPFYRSTPVLTYRIVLDEVPSSPELLAAADELARALEADVARNRSSEMYKPAVEERGPGMLHLPPSVEGQEVQIAHSGNLSAQLPGTAAQTEPPAPGEATATEPPKEPAA